MKIMYCTHGHGWDSTWPYAFIDSYIIETLKEMGHEVIVYDIFLRENTVIEFIKAYSEKYKLNPAQWFNLLNDRSTADLPLEVIETKPDLVLHIVGKISNRALMALKELKTKTAIWFLDDPQEIDKTIKMGTFYDWVYTVESACVDIHKSSGSDHVEFLPLGCFPKIQKKIEVEDKYKSDICLIGVPFPKRVEFIDSIADFLKDYNVKIIGGGPRIGDARDPWLWKRKLKRLDVLENFIIDEIVQPAEAAKYYNGAKINLNIHRAGSDERFKDVIKTKIEPKSVSGRTFEVAGCAAFQLIDQDRPNFREHFVEGKEIASFSDAEDFKKKVTYYLSHESERLAIAEAAQKRAYAEHTYKHRLQRVIDNASK